MLAPNIRVNTQAPFPALVEGVCSRSRSHKAAGIFTIGFSVNGLGVQVPLRQ